MRFGKIISAHIFVTLVLPGLLGGCRATAPTKARTYWAVRDYFGLKTTPYSILFSMGEMREGIEVWPIEIYPLNFRDEFERAYPGKYLLFRNEWNEWQAAEEQEFKEERAIAARKIKPTD